MAKLKADNNVLAAFLNTLDLSARERNFLQPCGSDGTSLYWNKAYLTDLKHIQSIEIHTVAKRLWRPLKHLTFFEVMLYVLLAFGLPQFNMHIKAFWQTDWGFYIIVLIALYACADALSSSIRHFSRPKQHHQLILHTRLGEKIVFAKSEHLPTLQALQTWLHQHQPTKATDFCAQI